MTITVKEYRKLVNKKPRIRSTKVRIDGYTFDSKAEARRYQELELLKKDGQIRDLKIHPRFALKVNKVLVCTYVADFIYATETPYGGILAPWTRVVEDVKGHRTEVYRLKKKLFEAIYWDGPKITEVAVK